jgi:NDP-sugar pyrophosphorylase family protein
LPKALLADDSRSHLVLTAQSNLGAFFSLSEDGTLSVDGDLKDYAGIAKFHPKHIEERETDRFSRMITELIDQKQIRGSYLQGDWFNVGTPEDLRYLNGAVNNLALFKEGLDD